jgi:hypothetical protein
MQKYKISIIPQSQYVGIITKLYEFVRFLLNDHKNQDNFPEIMKNASVFVFSHHQQFQFSWKSHIRLRIIQSNGMVALLPG